MDAYLTKPINAARLHETLDNAVGNLQGSGVA